MVITGKDPKPALIKTATYVGQRESSKGPLAFFWQFEGEANQKGYKKQITPAKIGERWVFCYDAEGRQFIGGDHAPARAQTNHTADPHDVDRWEAEAQIAIANVANKRMAKRLAERPGQFEVAMRPLLNMMNAIPYHQDRAAFVNQVVAALWRR